MSGIGESEPRRSRAPFLAGVRCRPLALPALAVRLVLGGLFLWAGAVKLSHPRAFAGVVEEYGVVPDGWPLVIVALAVPALEALAGVGVLFNRRAGYLLMLAMLVLFIGVLWFGMVNDLDVDCGCFSLDGERGPAGLKWAFARDWALAAGAAWSLWANRRGRETARPCKPTTDRGDRG